MKETELTFDKYAQDILPEKLERLKSLKSDAYSVKELFGRRQGEKSILKKLGRDSDFAGLYGFVDQGNVIYVGTSEKVINRLSYQIKGYTKYQAHLAWELAKEKELYTNKKKRIPNLTKAKKLMMNMQVFFLEVASPIERHLLELYSCMHFHCKFNFHEPSN